MHDEVLRNEMQSAWHETLALMGLSVTKSAKTKKGTLVTVTLGYDLTPQEWNKALRGLIETVWVEADGSLTVEGGFVGVTHDAPTSRSTAAAKSRPTAWWT